MYGVLTEHIMFINEYHSIFIYKICPNINAALFKESRTISPEQLPLPSISAETSCDENNASLTEIEARNSCKVYFVLL